jgi:ketosteroid isomerase-like protein
LAEARLLACVSLALATPLGAAPGAPSSHCSAPEHRQFDFWAGDWDAYDVERETAPSARVRVDLVLGGCALHEVYEGTNGLVGESFSVYDAARNVWHQSWVTNRGQLLALEGRFDGGRMTLEGTSVGADGKRSTVRGVWQPENGSVREWAETSTDSGKTWTKWFDLVFRARPLARTDAATSEADLVAALDTEYQAAVERNDAATMDRILADDFVLVLGNGTVHPKAELIEEARARSITWEQQKEIDASQRVRVWGSTAVVTAKLRVKGTRDGKAFDRKLWFSDTYVRTNAGWRYVFGQASLALPEAR